MRSAAVAEGESFALGDVEASGFFAVDGTKANPVNSALFKRDVVPDKCHHVRFALNLFNVVFVIWLA